MGELGSELFFPDGEEGVAICDDEFVGEEPCAASLRRNSTHIFEND